MSARNVSDLVEAGCACVFSAGILLLGWFLAEAARCRGLPRPSDHGITDPPDSLFYLEDSALTLPRERSAFAVKGPNLGQSCHAENKSRTVGLYFLQKMVQHSNVSAQRMQRCLISLSKRANADNASIKCSAGSGRPAPRLPRGRRWVWAQSEEITWRGPPLKAARPTG